MKLATVVFKGLSIDITIGGVPFSTKCDMCSVTINTDIKVDGCEVTQASIITAIGKMIEASPADFEYKDMNVSVIDSDATEQTIDIVMQDCISDVSGIIVKDTLVTTSMTKAQIEKLINSFDIDNINSVAKINEIANVQ